MSRVEDVDGFGMLAFDASTADLVEACAPLAEQLDALRVLLESADQIDVELPAAIAVHLTDEPTQLPARELRELALHRLLDALVCTHAARRVPF